MDTYPQDITSRGSAYKSEYIFIETPIFEKDAYFLENLRTFSCEKMFVLRALPLS